MKTHKLIVGHDFSIANQTDADSHTDYFPGIWAIGSQAEALRYAREILAHGDQLTVTDYDNPRYHAVANKIIKALGLKQKLFPEPKPLEQTRVTNGKPSSLAQLKRYLVIGRKIKIVQYDRDGGITNTRNTSITGTQTNAVITDRDGAKAWLEFGKAGGWTFDNGGAICFTNDRGEYERSVRIEYQD